MCRAAPGGGVCGQCPPAAPDSSKGWMNGSGIAADGASNKRKCREPPVELRWQHPQPAAVVIVSRSIGFLEIAPALVRASRHRRNGAKLGRADDIDSSVRAVLQPEDLLAADQPMLDDPIKRAADQLGRTPRPHPCRYPQLARNAAPGNPPLQRVEVAAGERDLGQV